MSSFFETLSFFLGVSWLRSHWGGGYMPGYIMPGYTKPG